jgi:hypothetical protein
MKVLVACEYSGKVRDAFIAKGHDAMSCDLLPTERPGPHHQGDVLEILWWGWDLMVAHPSCTYLCNSGVGWLHKDITRWPKLIDGAVFYRKLRDAPIKKKCIENPIMHKYARKIIEPGHIQYVQPWMFGHGETKATGLELINLPELKFAKGVEGREQRLHKLPPSEDRWKIRSETFQGIADAMAEQWGQLVK